MIHYCAINEKLSRHKWETCQVARDVETMAAKVEEVWFEVTSLFYFRENIIEQYFAILLRHTALWISTVNVDFAESKKTLSEVAVSVWEQV